MEPSHPKNVSPLLACSGYKAKIAALLHENELNSIKDLEN
jgi:hypothetical protein